MTMPRTSVVAYMEAREETRAAYLAGLRTLRGLEANPAAWYCRVCRKNTPGSQVEISYDPGETPITFCPTERCTGYGPDLTPVTG
jgi:hypothetical protein